MRTRRAALCPTYSKAGSAEVDLIPAEVNKLRWPEAVAIAHQDHGGVTVTVAVALGGIAKLLDLGTGQILPRAQFSVRATTRHHDCSIYGSWIDQFQVRLSHDIPPSGSFDCSNNNHF